MEDTGRRFELDSDQGEKFQFFRSESLDDGETKYFDPDPDEPCWVTLRLAAADRVETMYTETRTPVVERALNPKSRSMERIKDFDQSPAQKTREREMTWDYAIVSWEGVLDAHGTEVECILENKLRMMNVPIFARFVGKCLQMISGEVAGKKEADRKNL